MVLFADGIAPGEGTSVSENSSNEDEHGLTKPKKLSTRSKNRKNAKDLMTIPFEIEPSPIKQGKENFMDSKVSIAFMLCRILQSI